VHQYCYCVGKSYPTKKLLLCIMLYVFMLCIVLLHDHPNQDTIYSLTVHCCYIAFSPLWTAAKVILSNQTHSSVSRPKKPVSYTMHRKKENVVFTVMYCSSEVSYLNWKKNCCRSFSKGRQLCIPNLKQITPANPKIQASKIFFRFFFLFSLFRHKKWTQVPIKSNFGTHKGLIKTHFYTNLFGIR